MTCEAPRAISIRRFIGPDNNTAKVYDVWFAIVTVGTVPVRERVASGVGIGAYRPFLILPISFRIASSEGIVGG